eukprot:scaffold48503_cov33-Prasinocladus_malaysianus.AAC.2
MTHTLSLKSRLFLGCNGKCANHLCLPSDESEKKVQRQNGHGRARIAETAKRTAERSASAHGQTAIQPFLSAAAASAILSYT